MQAEFETVRQYMRQHRDPTALSALVPAIKFAVTERQGTYATGGETGNVCPKHHACSHPHAYILVIIFPHYDCILWNDSTDKNAHIGQYHGERGQGLVITTSHLRALSEEAYSSPSTTPGSTH